MKAKNETREMKEQQLRAKMLVYVIGIAILSVICLELALSLPGVMP